MRPFQLLTILLVVCALFSIASAGKRPLYLTKRSSSSRKHEEEDESPKPHYFDYAVNSGDTRFGQTQEADDDGNVEGEYSVLLPDGTTQTVKYRAHQVDGYFADVYVDGKLVEQLGEESDDSDSDDSDDSDDDSDDSDSDSDDSDDSSDEGEDSDDDSDDDDDDDDDDDEEEDEEDKEGEGKVRKPVKPRKPHFRPIYSYRRRPFPAVRPYPVVRGYPAPTLYYGDGSIYSGSLSSLVRPAK